MLVARLAVALALVACGGSPRPAPPIESRGGEAGATLSDPVEVLRALADAAKTDDGPALDALVHPTHGMWLWDQPGAAVSPSLHVTAGSAGAPTQWLAASGMNDYWKEQYWAHVAGGLARGLERLDREPADRFAPIYGDCGADDATGGADLRAWLVAKDSFESYVQLLVDTELEKQMAPALVQPMTHYRSWGLDVWLLQAEGRLWVAHVMVWTPCDA